MLAVMGVKMPADIVSGKEKHVTGMLTAVSQAAAGPVATFVTPS